MTIRKFEALGLFLVLLTASFSGCGQASDGRPPLGLVEGVVKLDGQPFAGAFVMFVPENGRPSVGTSNSDGKYVLEYLQDVPGAAIGSHEVRIVTASQGTDENSSTREMFPPKYNSQSTLTAVVVAGANTIDFDLDSK